MYVSVRPQDQVGGYESEEIHFTNAKTIENANLELLASFSRKNCSVLRAYGTLKKTSTKIPSKSICVWVLKQKK